MKKIIMFSGINKEEGFTLSQTKELSRLVETGLSISFITSDFYDNEKNDLMVDKLIKFFKDISIRFNKINIIDCRTNKEESKEIVKNSDIVFLMGGDPKKEMSYINEYDLAKILLDRDGITIGVSAGSINMAKDVIYRDEDENKTMIRYKGIGLTDICIYPHLDFKNIDYLHYVSIDGPAVQTVDADGKIINKMYVVNGTKLNEFEFEVFKASGKKNFL